MAAMHASFGSFEPTFHWSGPNWSNWNDHDSSMIGWLNGDGMTGDEQAKLDDYIAELTKSKVIFEGPLNYQDGSTFLKAGEVATDAQIWYAPQLLEGMTGDSSAE
jgi:simple sugar transport system substrate-binding protein